MSKVVKLVNPQVDARKQFQAHVQSIAFNLTLSRRMIDLLQIVRDWGFPHGRSIDQDASWWEKSRVPAQTGNDQFIMMVKALIARGLVLHDSRPDKQRKAGDKVYYLSRAGELTCELLVEAGLIAPSIAVKKEKRK